MKKASILSLLFLAILHIGCHKSGGSSGTGRLIGFQDSMKNFRFTYSGEKIGKATLTPPDYDLGDYATFEYSGKNYIKVSSSKWRLTVEYYLNASAFPVHILRNETGGDGTVYRSEVLFFYKPLTNLPDSAIDRTLEPTTQTTTYVFGYEGKNITSIIRKASLDFERFTDTTSYHYSSLPNVFRSSDPLMYIYANLYADLYGGPNAFLYFPKLFSESTLDTFSQFTGGGNFSSRLNIELSIDHKIIKDMDAWFVRKYFYQ